MRTEATLFPACLEEGGRGAGLCRPQARIRGETTALPPPPHTHTTVSQTCPPLGPGKGS